jgi:hypothetical protein
MLLPEQEVVIRAKHLSVDANATLSAKIETVLGQDSVVIEYAGRA